MGFITALIVAAIVVSTVVSIIQSFQAPKPSKISFGIQGDLGGSPRYGTFGALDNTVSNELAIPVLYGKLKLAGNGIWQTDAGETVSRIIGLCEGEVNSIGDVRANDQPVNDTDTPGSNYTAYVGTGTQKADSRLPANLRPDMELHNLAYLAVTLTASDKLKGGNPTVTSVVEGQKVEIWSGGAWGPTKVYSRNPAACVRDFLINPRYGLGVPKENLDDASFGAVYDYCEERVASSNTSGGGSGTSLLLHMDGADGSTSFADSSGRAKVVTAGGNAQIDTAQFKFGGASGLFDGSDDYLSIPYDSDFDFTGGIWTVEFYVRTAAATLMTVWSMILNGNNYLHINIQADGSIRLKINSSGATVVDVATAAGVISTGTWYQVAVVESGSNYAIYVDGAQQVLSTDENRPGSYTATIEIGRSNVEVGGNNFNGWLDDFTVTKGIAKYLGSSADVDGTTEARYRLDFTIDTQRPAQDILSDMMATFLGFMIYAGNKIKLKCERTEIITQYFGDGSTTKQNGTFDPNNIVKDSMNWNLPSIDERPNRMRIQWVDPDQNYVKVYTQVDDRIDQDDRNVLVIKDIALLGITRASQASRLAKFLMSRAKYASASVNFASRLESIQCEIGDVVAITHQSCRWVRKLFRITDMQESEDETIRFTCVEYNASIYDDRLGAAVITQQQPSGPNLYAPLSDVTNLTVAEDNFIQKDGVFATNILASWTALSSDELLRLDRHLIQISEDAGVTFRDVAFASSQKTSYRIVLGNVQTGVSFVVRVKTISDRGAESPGTDANITIQGKSTAPSDVQDFDVTFAGDHLAMSWSAIDDEDLFGYEIRVGNENSIWETATIITTELLGTTFDLFNFTRGTKKFFIKAIDNSANYSENAGEDSLTITDIPQSNVVLGFDLWQYITVLPHPLEGTLSSDLSRVPTNDYDPTYNRLALQPNTDQTWIEREQAGGTWAALQASSFRFGRETFVVTEESYITSVIDLGAIFNANYIIDIQTYSSSNLGFVSVQISTSLDNVTFTAFRTFTAGTYNARYVQFKFLIQATDSTTRVRVVSAQLTIDVPDKYERFLNQAISASGTTITLTQNFTAVKAIVVTTVGSSNYTPRIHDQSNLPTSFEVRLFDTSGVLQAGNVNIWVSGY